MDERAPAASPKPAVWATGKKDAVGTALGRSKLWFTLGRGIVTEVFYPHVDVPQIRELGFLIADGQGFWQDVKALPDPEQGMEDDRVPIPFVRHRHDRFDFRFRVCPDPDRDVLLVDFALEGDDDLTVYVLCVSRLGADARSNRAFAAHWQGRPVLWAEQGPFGLAICGREGHGAAALGPCSVGEVGASDLWQDFHRHGRMTWQYREAGPGEVSLGGALPRQGTLALGLASSKEAAATNAWSALTQGFSRAVQAYAAGWQAWHGTRMPPEDLAHELSPAIKALYTRSATVLKVHEDRTFPGALVASLSVPWGETSATLGGYHLVWSRDLVETAGAFLAFGAHAEARQILSYLISTQQADGHWLQNQWLGGQPFWQDIQLDETGFPVLLAGALKDANALEEIHVHDMVVRALRFLIHIGPVTSQDRWERDPGINAFTLAVVIAALVEGAECLDGPARACALMVADYWNARLEAWLYAEDTELARRFGVGGHYVRMAPRCALDDNTPDQEALAACGHDGEIENATRQVSTDFLQLVRFGLRDARDPRILASIAVADGLLRHETPNGPAWRRYNGDDYGEHADGSPFDGSPFVTSSLDGKGIGRAWPLLTGERGHYALLAGEDPRPYLEAMAAMTGPGGLLPEQVWDAPPLPEHGLRPGEPTGSAMPLAWAHAEFIKLCHSRLLGYPVDRPVATWRRYQGQRPVLSYGVWHPYHSPRALKAGDELRLVREHPFRVHWGTDGAPLTHATSAEDWGLAYVAIIPAAALRKARTLACRIEAQDAEAPVDVRIAIT